MIHTRHDESEQKYSYEHINYNLKNYSTETNINSEVLD